MLWNRTSDLSTSAGRYALVVFEHRGATWPLRMLRPGFRHCFCLVQDGAIWSLCDPLKTRIVLRSVPELTELDLLEVFEEQGAIVLRGLVASGECGRRAMLRPMTCVEVVKRILNLDLPSVFTPHQLYLRLLRLPAPFQRFESITASEIALDVIHE
ncbi:MAG: hypothetical protein AB7I59_08215 [Geminicoccaceae bacterium]